MKDCVYRILGYENDGMRSPIEVKDCLISKEFSSKVS